MIRRSYSERFQIPAIVTVMLRRHYRPELISCSPFHAVQSHQCFPSYSSALIAGDLTNNIQNIDIQLSS